ncbi:hypothetical protein BpHYR1_029191, partial [Brachionus plicatilis]
DSTKKTTNKALSRDAYNQQIYDSTSAIDAFSRDTSNQKIYDRKPAKEALSRDAYNQKIYDTTSAIDALSRDAYNQQIYDINSAKDASSRDTSNQKIYDIKPSKEALSRDAYNQQIYESASAKDAQSRDPYNQQIYDSTSSKDAYNQKIYDSKPAKEALSRDAYSQKINDSTSSKDGYNQKIYDSKPAKEALSKDAYNQKFYDTISAKETLSRDAFNQKINDTSSAKESSPRDANNQQINDTKPAKNSEQIYSEQYLSSKPSKRSGSILYEETFEHIRTVSEASGKDNLPNIKPGSTSISDDFYAKFGSNEFQRPSQQFSEFLPNQKHSDNIKKSKNQGYRTQSSKNSLQNQLYPTSYPDAKSNVVITQGYPDMVSQIYPSDRKTSAIRPNESTAAQSYVDNLVNQGSSDLSTQFTNAKMYSQGTDGYNQTLDSRKINNVVSSDAGLHGSVYIGDNFSNQSSIIKDVLKTATKITNGIDYPTILPSDNLNNLATSPWSNLYPSANYSSQAKDLENQALNELDKLVSNLSSSAKDDKIDWNRVQDGYSTEDALNKAGLMKNYVSSLIEHEKTKSIQLEQLDAAFGQKFDQNLDKLSVLDGVIDRVVNQNKVLENRNESASYSISVISDLVNEIKNNIRSRNLNLDEFQTGHKIIIKTTRRLPPKVISQSATNVADCSNRSFSGKKRVSSSHLSGSRTRVYELGVDKESKQNSLNSDLFNSKQNVDYSVHSYEPIVDGSLGKASTEKINKYLSVINTGIKNNDLIQIHPLLNNKTGINTKTNSGRASLSVKEPVVIGSSNYLQEVSQHFGGLKVTDFPMYVQGLEFKKSKKSRGSGLKKSESLVKQTVNNASNIQFVKVNSAAPVSQLNPIKTQ